MNEPNDQCSPRQLFGMCVFVPAHLMRDYIIAMSVGVEVAGPRTLLMSVKMHSITPQPPQNVQPKPEQHDTGQRFEVLGGPVRNGCVQHEAGARNRDQCQRVADAPEDAMAGNAADARSPALQRQSWPH